jgi:hypothetical protein
MRRKVHQRDHSAGSPALPKPDDRHKQFLSTLRLYASRHWAWPAIIALWLFSGRYAHRSDAMFTAIFLAAAVVIILGWRQLTAQSYWRGYFTILLVIAGLMVFVGAFSVLFILILIAILAVAVDLLFVAPHRS